MCVYLKKAMARTSDIYTLDSSTPLFIIDY